MYAMIHWCRNETRPAACNEHPFSDPKPYAASLICTDWRQQQDVTPLQFSQSVRDCASPDIQSRIVDWSFVADHDADLHAKTALQCCFCQQRSLVRLPPRIPRDLQ